jgi:hypothetical protein
MPHGIGRKWRSAWRSAAFSRPGPGQEEAAAALAAAEQAVESARVTVETRFGPSLSALRAGLDVAAANLEAARGVPEGPPEQRALLARSAAAERLLADAEARAAAAEELAAAEQLRDGAAGRARTAQAELTRHEQAIAEIARQRDAFLAPRGADPRGPPSGRARGGPPAARPRGRVHADLRPGQARGPPAGDAARAAAPASEGAGGGVRALRLLRREARAAVTWPAPWPRTRRRG